MKNFFENKVTIAIIFFIIGASSFWGISHNRHSVATKNSDELQTGTDTSDFFSALFNNDFFSHSRDPFTEMQRIQKQMLSKFNTKNFAQEDFDKWYQQKFGGGSPADIKRREDAQFVYYDIDLQGEPPKDVKVEVKAGQVFISAQSETKKEIRGTSSYESSQFERSFPAPDNVDAEHYQMERDANKIILKFPKKST